MMTEPSPQYSDSEATRIERMQDLGVWNGTMGAAAIEGAFAPIDYPANPSNPSTSKPRTPRPKPLETSGQMVSHDMAVQYAKEHPLDPETQPAINRRGRALIEAALDEMFGKDREIKAIIAEVERAIPIRPDYALEDEASRETALNGRLKLYFDRKAQQ